MKTFLSGFFVLAIVLAGGYYYQSAHSACRVPIEYEIGQIDPRFNITREEVRAAITDAESLWEDATGRNLFTYTEGVKFTIDFIFDERQQLTDEEEEAREVLDEKEIQSEEIRTRYKDLAYRYETLKTAYEKSVSSYESRLAEYNSEVERWNKKGGAPKEEFEKLEAEKVALAKERDTLNQTANDLNKLVGALNDLGEAGNDAIEDYNEDVAWYNSFFGDEREFTQGDYHGSGISIYQFDNTDELRRVLAHELGHSLSLDHVEDSASVMYYFMEGRFSDFKLSGTDLAEFNRVCGEG